MIKKFDKKQKNYKALVLGHDDRSFLTVIRSLGRKDICVHVGWCSSDSFALKSKYISKVHNIPKYTSEDDSWKKSLIDILKLEKFDLVIPCHDSNIIPLHIHKKELEKFSPIYLLSDGSFEITRDKIKTYELAKSLDIKVPEQLIIKKISEMAEVEKKFKYPIVLKPRSSIDINNLDYKQYVRKAYNHEDLLVYLKFFFEYNEEVQVQENLIGTGVGIEVLAENGEILVSFQHIRIHEPIMGGGSSYRKSSAIHPELMNATEKLIKALKYTGVAMVEFKVNFEDNSWALIEINGRLWGSLPLAVAAGADFPYYLFQLLVEGKKEFLNSYKTDLYCRNFLGDLEWLFENFYTDHSDKTLSTLPILKVVKEINNIIFFKEKSDVFVLDDLKPGFAELYFVIKEELHLIKTAIRLFPYKFKLIRDRFVVKIIKAIKNAEIVLFVCKGNVCRSPFAEFYLKKNLNKNIEIFSCGHLPEKDRSSPKEAMFVAKEYGVDLKNHRSKIISKELVQKADVIFIFDEENRKKVISSYPFSKKKVFMLGLLNKNGQTIIDDPYGKNIKIYKKTYDQISQALDKIKSYLDKP